MGVDLLELKLEELEREQKQWLANAQRIARIEQIIDILAERIGVAFEVRPAGDKDVTARLTLIQEYYTAWRHRILLDELRNLGLIPVEEADEIGDHVRHWICIIDPRERNRTLLYLSLHAPRTMEAAA